VRSAKSAALSQASKGFEEEKLGIGVIRTQTSLEETLQYPLPALASHHQEGYFAAKTHQNARYDSFSGFVSHPDGRAPASKKGFAELA
jgi:hypothetical protein